MKTDTGKEGVRGSNPGSSEAGEGEEPMYIYVASFPVMRSVRVNVVPALSANQKSSAKAPLTSCHHLPHPSQSDGAQQWQGRHLLLTGKKYLSNESEYSPPVYF